MDWNNFIRQGHRWLSIIFTVVVAGIFVTLGMGTEPAQWVYFVPLAPLALLMFSGLYMFVLPYAVARRRVTGDSMDDKTTKSAKAAKKAAAKPVAGEPVLLSGGNPQIAKGDGDAPVQAYIAPCPAEKAASAKLLRCKGCTVVHKP